MPRVLFASRRALCISLFCVMLIAAVFVSGAPAKVAADGVRRHVQYLSSDELEGRMSGEPGHWLALQYITDTFEQLGLTSPADADYLQHFEMKTGVAPGAGTRVKLGDTEWVDPSDVLPVSSGSSGEVTGPVIFAGYGIASGRANHNSFDGLDVDGKIILVISGAPTPSHDPGEYARAISPRIKTSIASVYGATGVIYVRTDEDGVAAEPLPFAGSTRGRGRVPAVSMSRACALEYLGADWAPVFAENQNAIRSKLGAELGQGTLVASVEDVIADTANAAGVLVGTDPELMWEYVVVGAHSDHVGVGGDGQVYNGADDNASGTAGVLALAEELATVREPTRRSILFLCFSGEELGLHGSRHYVEDPLIPIERTRAMVNMDMLGHFSDNGLMVFGTETGEGLTDLFDGLAQARGIDAAFGGRAPGGSDHAPFAEHRVPVVFLFTGMHQHYHKPTDDWDTIDYAGETAVLNLTADLIETLANADEPPTWVEEEEVDTPTRGVLGVYGPNGSGQTGYPITQVIDGYPAQKAGLRAGDVILKIDGQEVARPAALTQIMSGRQPGDEVTLTVQRGEEVMEVTATLAAP